MTQSKLFVSSCSRRELVRRRNRSGFGTAGVRFSQLSLTLLAFIVVCAGAFLAGRGGI
jgi:hypothetical protein